MAGHALLNEKHSAETAGDFFAAFPALASVAIIMAMILFQGGYYAGSVCAIGILGLVTLAVTSLLHKVELRFTWMNICLLVIAVAYAVSAAAHGLTFTMAQETCTWFVIVGLSLWIAFDTQWAKRRALKALMGCGAAFATAGLLIFASGLPVEGAVNAGRLMFPFQYANTSGLFFAVTSILCLGDERRAWHLSSLVSIAALMLTQSGGAILVFGVGLLAMCIRWVHESRPGWLRVAAGLSIIALACAGAGFFMRHRIVQAIQTLIERVVQVFDAISLFSGNVLLGIGPDQWQFVYPEIQTAQYRAANVHCSYMQIALDAGIVALLALLAIVGIGFWRLVKCGEAVCAICVAMMAVHALIDFDLMFAAVAMTLFLLVSEPRDRARGQILVSQRDVGLALAWTSIALVFGASCLGIYLDIRAVDARWAALASEPEKVAAIMGDSPFMGDDALMESYKYAALFSAGKYRELIALDEGADSISGEMALQRAVAQYRLDDSDTAAETIAYALHRFPYDPELYKEARAIIEGEGEDGGAHKLFNDEAARANQLAESGHAAWLDNQVEIELFQGSESAWPSGEGR